MNTLHRYKLFSSEVHDAQDLGIAISQLISFEDSRLQRFRFNYKI
ncbi:hypothetical protein HanXRQr2_Chr09g0402581 [Helianthus annuus]|uniref:Uncharacterized protein n=1 Tax=Helianthus annuus TaxID=4232 RepID=A0A9K3I8H6_HELAN|nr:hypothetical protein HanXRQr2_Chr09g0402581 [Helianthus annuus]